MKMKLFNIFKRKEEKFKIGVFLYRNRFGVGDSYGIYYWKKNQWNLLTTAITYPTRMRECYLDLPWLFSTFEEAVKEAKKFLSINDIENYLAKEKRRYDERMAGKSWVSTDDNHE